MTSEDGEGLWKVGITGRKLHVLHRELALGRREYVHIGKPGDAVTGVKITGRSPPKR